MFRRLLLLLTLFFLPALALGQFTTVTATVPTLQNATYTIDFVNLSAGGPPLLGGISVFPTQLTGAFTSSGFMQVSLADNNQVLPLPSQWKFNICVVAPVPPSPICFNLQLTITGTTQDISAQISAVVPNIPSSGAAVPPGGVFQSSNRGHSGFFSTGVFNSEAFLTGSGNNGIANCTSLFLYCVTPSTSTSIETPYGYGIGLSQGPGISSGTTSDNWQGGGLFRLSHNAYGTPGTKSATEESIAYFDLLEPGTFYPGGDAITRGAVHFEQGIDYFTNDGASTLGFKSNQNVAYFPGYYFSDGQNETISVLTECYAGSNDCIPQYSYLYCAHGSQNDAAEGCHLSGEQANDFRSNTTTTVASTVAQYGTSISLTGTQFGPGLYAQDTYLVDYTQRLNPGSNCIVTSNNVNALPAGTISLGGTCTFTPSWMGTVNGGAGPDHSVITAANRVSGLTTITYTPQPGNAYPANHTGLRVQLAGFPATANSFNTNTIPSDTTQVGTCTSASSSCQFTFHQTGLPDQSVTGGTAVAQTQSAGTQTLPILTTGLPSGFNSNTSALGAAGTNFIACLENSNHVDQSYYECVQAQVADSTHITFFNMQRPHPYFPIIGGNGPAGYAMVLNANVDGGDPTQIPNGKVFQYIPIVGCVSTSLCYYDNGFYSITTNESHWINASDTIISATCNPSGTTPNVVTVSYSSNPGSIGWNNIAGAVIAGNSQSSFNGTFTTSAVTGQGQFTYPLTCTNGTTGTGGTVSLINAGFQFLPWAAIFNPVDPATGGVSGNAIPYISPLPVAFNSGDKLVVPVQKSIAGNSQFNSFNEYGAGYDLPASGVHGVTILGQPGNSTNGFSVNIQPDTGFIPNYFHYGGSYPLPSAGIAARGYYTYGINMQAGDAFGIFMDCNNHGCTDPVNSPYGGLYFKTATGARAAGWKFFPANGSAEYFVTDSTAKVTFDAPIAASGAQFTQYIGASNQPAGTTGFGDYFVPCGTSYLSEGKLCLGNGAFEDSSGILGAKQLVGAQIYAGALSPNVFNVGTFGVSGSTTYTYACTSVTPYGESLPAYGTTNTGNATLSSSNYNFVECVGQPGAQSLNVYRTVGGAAQGFIGNFAVGATFTNTPIFDTGLTANPAIQPPTIDTTGSAVVQGPISGASIGSGTSANTDMAGEITAVAGTATYTFKKSLANRPECFIHDHTTPANDHTNSFTVTATTLTVTSTGATDVIGYGCFLRN